VFSWLIRLILIIAGVVAEWFIARDSPRFQPVELSVSILLVVFIVFVLALWPTRWSQYFNGMYKKCS
jgi:uncharacterized membrane protein YoaK (UPF0700 family)